MFSKWNHLFLTIIMIILTILTNLVLSLESQADPLAITGNEQMSIGGSQTLRVSGGNGSYTWAKVGGSGTVSILEGNSVNFTAPTANPYCVNNPTICVEDSNGQKVCKQIAINAQTNDNYEAYEDHLACMTGCIPCDGQYHCGASTGVGSGYAFACGSNYYNCAGTSRRQMWDAVGSCGSLSWCESSVSDPRYCGGTPGIIDLRFGALKLSGCCPAALLGQDGSAPNGLGNAPNSNLCNVGSSANVRTGNLFHSQEVGKQSWSGKTGQVHKWANWFTIPRPTGGTAHEQKTQT